MRADRLVAALLFLQHRGRVTAAELADELEVSVADRPPRPRGAVGRRHPRLPAARSRRRLVAGRRRPHRPQRTVGHRDPGAVPARRPGRVGLRRGQDRAAQAGARPPPDLPRRRGGGRQRHHDRPHEVERGRPSATGAGRPAADRRRTPPQGPADLHQQRPGALGPAGRPVGPRRQGRDLVPHRRHRARPAHVPARPGGRGRADRRARRAPDDFALDAAWQQVVGEVEQKRSRTWATLLIETRFVPILRDHFGRHCHTEDRRSTTAAAGCASPPRRPATSPATWPAGDRWSRCSSRRRSRRSWHASAASCTGRYG